MGGTVSVFGLTGDKWTAIAAIAQGMAAVGAMALLFLTWSAQREARDAVSSARDLASATQALVTETRSQRRLAILPVIEVSFEPNDQRLRFDNKGTGPIIAPQVLLAGTTVRFVAPDPDGKTYRQSGALPVGGYAFALMESPTIPAGDVTISGFLLSGDTYTASVESAEFGRTVSIVAREP